MTNYYINKPIPLVVEGDKVLEYIVDAQYVEPVRFKVSCKSLEVYLGVKNDELYWERQDILSLKPITVLTPEVVKNLVKQWFEERLRG